MISIQDILINAAKLRPNHIGLQTINQKWSYQEILAQSMTIANFLKLNYNRSKMHVGLQFNNEPDFIFCFFGVLMAGHVVIPLPTSSKKSEIVNAIKNCDIDIILSNESSSLTKEDINFSFKWINLKEVSLMGYTNHSLDFTNTQNNDLALMLMSSGSTGNPKIIMLSHMNIISNSMGHGKRLDLTEEDIFLITMPIHFSSVITTQVLSCILFGTRIFLNTLPMHPKVLVNLIEKFKISCLAFVPTKILELIQLTPIRVFENVSLVIISGAPISQDLYNRINGFFPNSYVLQTYGLTEASPRVSIMHRNDKSLSCGKPIEGITVKTIDETGMFLKEGEKGELVVKGPNVMQGYYKSPQLTNKVIKDGWLHTGDIGYISEDGNIFITGRKKNIIISGGINIHPEEIEEVIKSIVPIENVIVISNKDPLLGEVPVALIKQLNNVEIDVTGLKRKLNTLLSTWKVPRKIIIVDDIPTTFTGKVLRNSNSFKKYSM